MDWLKLFALLIAVMTVFVTAELTRKKIRIHIPQRVKHIHHHKKIYITNHPASSQYAPAYLPTAEAMTVALPTVAGLVPLKPLPLFEDRRSGHLQAVAASASPLLPMYRARGFYGPEPSWESHDFDLVPPPGPSGPTAAAIPTAFSSPSGPAAASSAKRIKIVKVQPSRKKKIIRKKKPKRIIIQDMNHEEPGERPVSTFHEQFYADVEGAGTIRKIKKPKRVEKIIDGDTEHIHTYSEEHIHKLVFDDPPHLAGLAGVDPSGTGVTALASNNPLLPIKNSHALLALEPSLNQPVATGYGGDTNVYSDLGQIGSLGTSGQLEYSSYNPREVTHDHVFHDHGEIPAHMDIHTETLGFPPKVSYNSQGLKMTGQRGKIRQKNRWVPQNNKPTRPLGEFSYYENMYPAPAPAIAPAPIKRPQRPYFQKPKYNDETALNTDISYDDYKPIPQFRPRQKTKQKLRGSSSSGYQGHEHKTQGHRQHSNADLPFSTSSTVFHDLPHNPPRHSFSGVRESGLSSLANFKDPFTSFKDIYSNNFEYDAYASPSNSNPESPAWPIKASKGKKKSISTQNISFGGQDHKTVVDHLADMSNVDAVVTDERGAPVRNVEDDQSPLDSVTPASDYTITEFSPEHEYYSSMALKAFHDQTMSVPESSNTNYQIVEAPTPHTTIAPLTSPLTSTSRPLSMYFEDRPSTIGTTTIPTLASAHTMKIPKKPKQKSKPREMAVDVQHRVRHTVAPSSPSGTGASPARMPTGFERREPPRRGQGRGLERGAMIQRAARAYERPQEKMVHVEEHSKAVAPSARGIPTGRGNLRYGDKLAGEDTRSF